MPSGIVDAVSDSEFPEGMSQDVAPVAPLGTGDACRCSTQLIAGIKLHRTGPQVADGFHATAYAVFVGSSLSRHAAGAAGSSVKALEPFPLTLAAPRSMATLIGSALTEAASVALMASLPAACEVVMVCVRVVTVLVLMLSAADVFFIVPSIP